MPKSTETTTKFRVDISELKAGIREANRQIALANSEFKKASAGMESWAKDADGLSAKLKQLRAVTENYEIILSSIEQQYAKVVEEQGEDSKGATDLKIKINNLKAAIQGNNAQIERYEQSLQTLNQEQDNFANETQGAISASDKLKSAIAGQEGELNRLKSAYTDVALEQGESGTEAKRLAGEIEKLSSELKNNKAALSEAEGAADAFDKSLEETNPEEEAKGFTILKGALAELVADGIKAAAEAFKDFVTESGKASASFQAQTGATTGEMKEFNSQLQEMYKNNYGESLQELGDKMAYVKQVTGEVDPSKLKEMTENAIGLEDTFGSDFNETIRGVNNLMEHFGLGATEAFDLFAKGSQKGLDYTDELGDNIAEYGGNFALAGYSAEEYFQLLENGSKGGAYNLDKVNDSINEVKNRLGDGTIAKNIGQFSGDTKTAFENWQKGKGTMKDVINSIVSDISNAENEQEALTRAATAFGTMGEDANLDVVKSLTTMGNTFKDVKGTMESVKDVKYSDVGSQFSEIGRLVKTELLQPIVDMAVPAIKQFSSFIINNFSSIAPVIAGVATAFGVLAAALGIQALINGVQKAFLLLNGTMLANPIVLIVAAIAGLVAAFVTLWNKSEAFRNFWIGMWEGIKSLTGNILTGIATFFTTTIPNAINAMLAFFQNLPSSIAAFLSNVLAAVTTWAGNMGKKALEMGQKFVTNVVNFFKQLPGKIANLLTQALTKVTKWASNMAAKARSAGQQFVKNVINFITQLPGKISSLLSKVISGLASFVSNMAAKGKAAASKFSSSIINGIKSIPGKVGSIGKNIVSGIWSGISGAAGWLKSKIDSFAKGIVDAIKKKFKIKSPSRVFRDEVGKQIVAGIAVGIGQNTAIAVNSINALANEMLNKALKANGNYSAVGKSIVESFSDGITSYTKKATDAVTKLVNSQVTTMTKKNKKNKSKYSKAGKEVIEAYTKAMETATAKAKETLSKKLDEISQATQEKYDAIANLQKSMNDKLAEYGDLYVIGNSGRLVLKDIKTDIDTLNQYGKNLEKLKGKISEDLMSEITEMQVSDAVAYTNALLNMSEKELSAYNDQYSEKLKIAADISRNFYADKVAEIKREYVNKVNAAFAETKSQLRQAGQQAIDGFIKGMTSGKGKLSKEVKKIANSIVKAMKKTLKINSPSKVFEKLGIYSGQGYGIGFVNSLEEAKKAILSALPTDLKSNAGKGFTSGSTYVTNNNFYQTNNSPKALSRLEIYRQTKNQLAFAKGAS